MYICTGLAMSKILCVRHRTPQSIFTVVACDYRMPYRVKTCNKMRIKLTVSEVAIEMCSGK